MLVLEGNEASGKPLSQGILLRLRPTVETHPQTLGEHQLGVLDRHKYGKLSSTNTRLRILDLDCPRLRPSIP